MMAGIGAKDTKPEMIIRRGLHAMGYRFRLHDKSLPGKPDIVFPKFKSVILVHGCFWHAHECHLFKWPSTRGDFWKSKIRGNKERDERNLKALKIEGWRTITIWECALKGPTRLLEEDIFVKVSLWLENGTFGEITGNNAPDKDTP